MLRILALLLTLALLGLAEPKSPPKPQYAANGELIRPRGFRTWVQVGASLGLGYSENAKREHPGAFQNVYLHPDAYAGYQETGEFPEGTMLALVIHEPEEKQSIALHGYFQGKLIGLEFAVKDSSRFEESWAYYEFGGPEGLLETAPAFPKERCFACHQPSGQKDNVFVQFYPVLRDGPEDE